MAKKTKADPAPMADSEYRPAEESLTLPGEVIVAMQARRPEMIAILRARLRGGDKLSTEQVDGCLAAIGELIKLHDQATLERNALESRLKLLGEGIEQVHAATMALSQRLKVRE